MIQVNNPTCMPTNYWLYGLKEKMQEANTEPSSMSAKYKKKIPH